MSAGSRDKQPRLAVKGAWHQPQVWVPCWAVWQKDPPYLGYLDPATREGVLEQSRVVLLTRALACQWGSWLIEGLYHLTTSGWSALAEAGRCWILLSPSSFDLEPLCGRLDMVRAGLVET